ncbi:MAG: hypothetical protein KAW91_05740 [candidate division Zixibacteria bacterium]|nr:hypothetical protein [candidate division Zixibacteria bacterium]
MKILAAAITVGLLVGVGSGASGTTPDSASADSLITDSVDLFEFAPFVISVDRVVAAAGRIYDTLDVTLKSHGRPVAGFDLKIATASDIVDIVEVLPGELHDSCHWEFFNARRVQCSEPTEGYPSAVWRAIALAEVVPDSTRPVCYGLGREISLLRLVVSSERRDFVPDTAVAIFFFWESCTDNSMANVGGDTLSLSLRTVDHLPTADFERDSSFPTRFGVPDECLDGVAQNRPLRRIEFHNGGVEFRMELESDSAEDSP